MIRSFKPVIDNNCKVLILGTMPGARSLEKQEYYGHQRNSFWKIIFSLFNHKVTEDYEDKKAFLLKHNIALWDVLQACDREGSLDSNIKNPLPNDFRTLFEEHPSIKAIYFNGDPAQKLFKRLIEKNVSLKEIPKYRLPSTSPANATSFEKKLLHWSLLLMSLENLEAGKFKGFHGFIEDNNDCSYEVYMDFIALKAIYRTRINKRLTSEELIMFSEDQLIDFCHRLFETGVLLWKENYENTAAPSIGKHWRVSLELIDGTLNYTGKSAFPSQWKSLCECIVKLIQKPFG